MTFSTKGLNTVKYSLITLVIVLLPVAYYLFYYVPSKVDYFTHRNLRLLAKASTNFSARIQGYQSWIDATMLRNEFVKNEIRSLYVADSSRINTVQEYETLFERSTIQQLVDDRLQRIENLAPDSVTFNALVDDLPESFPPAPSDNFTYTSTISYQTPQGVKANLLHINYEGTRKSYSSFFGNFKVHISATSDISKSLAPLINTNIFDNVLLFENDAQGRVIYQMDKNQFLATRIDSISSNLQRTHRTSSAEYVKMGNVSYHVFVQPVQINNLVKITDTGEQQPVELTLVGLVNSEQFINESRAISHFKISMFLFLVFLLLISLPLIKIQFVGRLEQISRLDLVLSIFSIVVGAGVITFLLVSVYSNTDDKKHLEKTLTFFAEDLREHFHKEVDSIFTQVDTISSRLFQHEDSLYNAILQNDASPGIVTSVMAYSALWDSTDNLDLLVPRFSQIAYVKRHNGIQELKLTQDSSSTPLVDVSHRAYYQQIKNDRGWWDKDRPYFVESIISFTTGEISAVLSFPDRYKPDSLIAAVSVRFISLLDVVTPGSFGFAIINETGQVQFHSDETKNLQENLFEETDYDPDLLSSVYARTYKKTTVNYLGRDHLMVIEPMPALPWSMVTFVELTQIRGAELNALLIAAFFFAVLVIYYVLLFLAFKMVFPYRGFHWLMPQKSQETHYKLFYLFMFATSGVLYFLIFLIPSVPNLILAFFAPVVVVPLIYRMFNPKGTEGKFLEIKHIRLYLQLVAVGIALLLIVTRQYEGASWSLVILLGLLLSSILVTRLLDKYRFPPYYVSYVSCVIGFLLIASILPSISFFRISYNAEMDLLIKQVQRTFLQDLSERQIRLEQQYNSLDFSAANSELVEQARKDIKWDVYINFFQNSEWCESAVEDSCIALAEAQRDTASAADRGKLALQPNPSTAEIKNQDADSNGAEFDPRDHLKASALESFLAILRNNLGVVEPLNWELYYNKANDGIWQWKQPSDSLVQLTKQLPHAQENRSRYLITESRLHPFSIPTNMLWSMGLVLLLIAIIMILLYFIRKMLMLDITLPERTQQTTDTIAMTHNTIFIGPPGSGKSDYIRELTDSYSINFRLIDDLQAYLKEIEYGKKITDAQLVVLDHFDTDLDNFENTRLKLKLVKRLISTYKKTVILVSVIDPIRFILESSDELQPSELRLWLQTFNSFTKVYHNIRKWDNDYEQQVNEYRRLMSKDLDEEKQQKNKEFCQALLQESNHSPFLRQVGYEILFKFDFEREFYNRQAMIDEMLQRTETYYQAIWQACSIEEKVTLLHFARNGFVTRKDADVLRVLLQKGLILRQSRFVLLNDSFRKFLRQKRSSKEIKAWAARQEKSWGNIRTPVITFLIAVALFVFVTQREAFNQWIALISTFVAGVPALLKLFSIMSPLGQKAKSRTSS